MITIDNKKVHDYIVSKDALVEVGRSISREIELIEIKIKRIEEKEKRITGKVAIPKELTDKGDELLKQLKDIDTKLTEVANQIEKSKLDAIPAEMKKDHEQLFKDKEVKERDRNKIALKVQKIKDKLIPIVQREVKPLLLDRFDDIETAKAKDGKVVISTFNHLEEFKRKFNR